METGIYPYYIKYYIREEGILKSAVSRNRVFSEICVMSPVQKVSRGFYVPYRGTEKQHRGNPS
ncbi:MAG: hypothetical protein B6245_01535 [Desulfobacteraceae bacterium 4572_88]|nr:MAG: hypothetical protein B6245_01535 [Desulfobacteraceae bacterium 4572_88]